MLINNLKTHNLALASPIADFSVDLKGGKVFAQGAISDVLASDRALGQEEQNEEALEKAENDVADPEGDKATEAQLDNKKDGKLIVEEEREEGRVSWAAGESHHHSSAFPFSLDLDFCSCSQTLVACYDREACHPRIIRCSLYYAACRRDGCNTNVVPRLLGISV